MIVTSFDTETHMIGPGKIAPPIVCASFASRFPVEGNAERDVRTWLYSTVDFDEGGPLLDTTLEHHLQFAAAGKELIVGHNIAYDLSVVVARLPHLIPTIFEALLVGSISDTMIREKLLDLAIDGDIEYRRLPDGNAQHRDYSLAGLESVYLGRDRTHDKDDEDAWRTNYALLDSTPSDQWPPRARQYALDDAEGTLLVWEAQNERAAKHGVLDVHGEVPTETFQVGAAFCLRLMECWGLYCDLHKKAEIEARLREEMVPERMVQMLKTGILEPRKGQKEHVAGCPKGRCACPKKDKISRKTLLKLVEAVCAENDVPLKKKEPTEKQREKAIEAGEDPDQLEGNTSADKNVLEEIAHYHPALEEYQYRQYLSKLVNTELPRMSGPVVYPRYNVLVASGRTSSFAAEEYASSNIQNVSSVKKLRDALGEETGEEINVRECYVPRPRRKMASIDVVALEFCSMGQVCYDLFGYSVMRDLINEGRDPHAYLGAQIALHQHDEFAVQCRDFATDPIAVYEEFKACETADDEDLVAFYKKYRKIAKPVGFGFPGGLGIKKFVGFAKAHPYYVRVTEEQAKALKEIWFRTFPEMRDYFDWVETQEDPDHDGFFVYTTPFGMKRAACTYTAMCNGALLQSPAAEGMKLAVWSVVRACYDPTLGSILYGQRALAFIHDELLMEFSGDKQRVHDCAMEVARLIEEAVKTVMPSMTITAKPALMAAWNKDAETVFDADGLLDVWHPKQKKAKAA